MDQPTQVVGQDQTKNHTTDNDENPGWTDSHKRQRNIHPKETSNDGKHSQEHLNNSQITQVVVQVVV